MSSVSESGLLDLSFYEILSVQPAPYYNSLKNILCFETFCLQETVKIIRVYNLTAIASATFGTDWVTQLNVSRADG